MQRLIRLPDDRLGQPNPFNRGLLGNRFELDYMGSAEYEWGAPQQSADIMKAQQLQSIPRQLTRNGVTKTVYFVASPSVLDQFWDAFVAWATEPRPVSREESHFNYEFDERNWLDEPLSNDPHERTHAWWSLEEHIIWTLDWSIAQELLDSLER